MCTRSDLTRAATSCPAAGGGAALAANSVCNRWTVPSFSSLALCASPSFFSVSASLAFVLSNSVLRLAIFSLISAISLSFESISACRPLRSSVRVSVRRFQLMPILYRFSDSCLTFSCSVLRVLNSASAASFSARTAVVAAARRASKLAICDSAARVASRACSIWVRKPVLISATALDNKERLTLRVASPQYGAPTPRAPRPGFVRSLR